MHALVDSTAVVAGTFWVKVWILTTSDFGARWSLWEPSSIVAGAAADRGRCHRDRWGRVHSTHYDIWIGHDSATKPCCACDFFQSFKKENKEQNYLIQNNTEHLAGQLWPGGSSLPLPVPAAFAVPAAGTSKQLHKWSHFKMSGAAGPEGLCAQLTPQTSGCDIISALTRSNLCPRELCKGDKKVDMMTTGLMTVNPDKDDTLRKKGPWWLMGLK